MLKKDKTIILIVYLNILISDKSNFYKGFVILPPTLSSFFRMTYLIVMLVIFIP